MKLTKTQLDAMQYVLEEYIDYRGGPENLQLINLQDKVDLSPNAFGLGDFKLIRESGMVRAKCPTLEGNAAARFRVNGLNERLDTICAVWPRFIPGVV